MDGSQGMGHRHGSMAELDLSIPALMIPDKAITLLWSLKAQGYKEKPLKVMFLAIFGRGK